MEDLEKIKIMLKHFVEHTLEHSVEFEDLAKRIQATPEGKYLAEALLKASFKLKEAVEILKNFI